MITINNIEDEEVTSIFLDESNQFIITDTAIEYVHHPIDSSFPFERIKDDQGI